MVFARLPLRSTADSILAWRVIKLLIETEVKGRKYESSKSLCYLDIF